MRSKERDTTADFSPLMFMAHLLEIIAVVLFLVMVIFIGFSQQSLETQLGVLELIGILVLFAWLVRKIDKMIQIPGDALDTLSYRFSRFLTNVAPAGSSAYVPIELKNLCSWHRHSFWMALGAFMLVSLPALVILAIFSLVEDSPLQSTVWKWTYVCAISLMTICLVWMIGTLFHARRRCASKVADGLGKSTM